MKNILKLLDKFDDFEKVLKNNDINKLKYYLESLRVAEDYFLKNYDYRKSEGVYYTNKEISDFIVNESLKIYLDNRIGGQLIHEIKDIYELNDDLKSKVSKILLSIRICDPACGSGVFLLSLVEQIYDIVQKINPELKKGSLKNQLIENIYGFDINEHAIKLCILKLFKWKNFDDNNDLGNTFSILKSNINVKNSLLTSEKLNFDIIIGNPPYGNILSQDEKNILKKEHIFYKDIYCAFLLKSLEWCNGIIGYLVPKSFLLRQGYIMFRNKLLSRANLLKIFDIGSKLFKNATNEVQILIYENKNEYPRHLMIYDYPNKEIITYYNQNVDLLRICLNNKCPLSSNTKKIYNYTFDDNCSYCGSITNKINRIRIKPNKNISQIIAKIEDIGDLNYLNIKKFPKMIRGEEDKGLKEVKKILFKNSNNNCVFINAKQDFKYYYIEKNKSFDIERINSNVLKGNNYEYYLSPKLLIKHNNIIPEAYYSAEDVCFTSSIYSLLYDDIDELKYICSFLNSALIQFYCIYGINNQKDTTINLNQYMIRHLPFIKSHGKDKTKIIELADKIAEKLKSNNGIYTNDIFKLYRELDNEIFSLYGFNIEEREIILSTTTDKISHFNTIYKLT